jgi:hypothetical protein
MPRPATTTWNWSVWWKCGRVTSAQTLLDQEGHRVQRIVGRRQGVAVGTDKGGVPAGQRLASASAAGEDAVGDQDHCVLRYCCMQHAQRRIT